MADTILNPAVPTQKSQSVRGKADEREDAAGLGKYGENQDKARRLVLLQQQGMAHMPSSHQARPRVNSRGPQTRGNTGLKCVGPSPIPLASLRMLYPAATGIPLANPAIVMQITVPKKGVRSFTSCSETTSDT